MSDLSITADGALLIKRGQEEYLKELLFGLRFSTPTDTFTIVAIGNIDRTGAFIQIQNEDILTVAHLYIDEEVFITKDIKQSDLEVSRDEDGHLTCHLKEFGNRILCSI